MVPGETLTTEVVADAAGGAYPWELVREIVGPDGTRLRVRPIPPDDADRLVALHGRLSVQTIYQRFFSVLRRLPTDWARYLARVDYERRLALVVERDLRDGLELVGVARYEPTGEPDRAEVAFVIEDCWQGQGLGTALFGDLLAAAEARGIHVFTADVLADNTRMLDLIARFITRVVSRRLDGGVLSLVFTREPAARSGGACGGRRSGVPAAKEGGRPCVAQFRMVPGHLLMRRARSARARRDPSAQRPTATCHMTSNIGSQLILELRGADERSYERMRDQVMEALRRQFRPEFLNRVDEVVVFRALTEAELARIVEIQLEGLRRRLAERRMTLAVTDAARAHLARAGYDPVFGARPLKRVIQRDVETPIARLIVAGKLVDGATVGGDAVGDRLQVEPVS
jgi:RimJ/RimL family protein N-acetyltransferase